MDGLLQSQVNSQAREEKLIEKREEAEMQKLQKRMEKCIFREELTNLSKYQSSPIPLEENARHLVVRYQIIM